MPDSICSRGPAAFSEPGYPTLTWQPKADTASVLLKLVYVGLLSFATRGAQSKGLDQLPHSTEGETDSEKDCDSPQAARLVSSEARIKPQVPNGSSRVSLHSCCRYSTLRLSPSRPAKVLGWRETPLCLLPSTKQSGRIKIKARQKNNWRPGRREVGTGNGEQRGEQSQACGR